MMLFIKRAVTTFIFFWILLVLLSIGAGTVGALADKNDLQTGEQFVEKNKNVLMISVVGLSGLGSVILAFGGILPWCRKKDNEV